MSQYNDIKITPNIGVSSDPKIEFIGAGNSTITLKVLDTADGGITFEGQKSELFSLIDADVSFGSSVASFSVNDFYGIPHLQVYNNGRVLVAPCESHTVGIGTTVPSTKMDVRGDLRVGINTSQGIILTSPNGTTFRLVVDNSGTLSAISTTL
jgi:hypothetical protein